QAEVNMRKAYAKLEEEQQHTKDALAREKESFQQVRAVVDRFIEVTEEELQEKPELQGLRRKLLGAALAYYQLFIEQRSDDPTLHVHLAASHLHMAKILDAIGSPADARVAIDNARQLTQQTLLRKKSAAPELQGILFAIFNTARMLRG